jgi:hypothetical protein
MDEQQITWRASTRSPDSNALPDPAAHLVEID